jgi:hypothetical protein
LRAALLEISRLSAEAELLRSKLSESEGERRRLHESLHLGSDTSGIPPSKGWKANCAPGEAGGTETAPVGGGARESPTPVTGYINGKAGEKRKPGGQERHAPASMRVDGVREGGPVHHYPSKCASCPSFDRCVEAGIFRKRSTAHGYDIEVVRVHREHIMLEATECPSGGALIQGGFPAWVIGTRFYELNVQLHVLTWHHNFHGSYERISLAAKELLSPISRAKHIRH